MKNKITILVFSFFLFSSLIQAQQLEPLDYERKLSYTEFETDYYLINQEDLDRVSLVDKVKLKEIKFEREYEKYINENDERTTIIKHISSENIYEDWMEEPEVIFIDKNAVALYTHDGEMVNRIEHAPEYLKLADNLGSDLLPSFIVPSRDDLIAMESMGFIVEELEGDYIKITISDHQLIYNEELLYLEQISLDPNGDVNHSLQVHFMQLPNGDLVHERVRESQIIDFENNVKAEHVFLKLFSNYRIENTYSKSQSLNTSLSLNVRTDVNQSKAILEYTPFSKESSSEISIYNISGRRVKMVHSDNSGNNEISINDLPPGIYILRIQVSGKVLSEKFVKL